MYYYKLLNGDYQSSLLPLSNLDEISEEEYKSVVNEIEEFLKEQQESEKETEERIAALEEENAALLYKLLTGEDLEDEE